MTQRKGGRIRHPAWLGLAPALLALLWGMTGLADASASGCGGFTARAPRFATDHELRTSVLCLVNEARSRHGVPPLSYNDALRNSATYHSGSMVRSGVLSHNGPRGSTLATRIARSGYLSRAGNYRLAENIAAGAGPARGSPLAIVRRWMNSAEHRGNILDPLLHDFGVGVARGDPSGNGERAATYTLDFGARG
jgi:uncharacterized protein YkwD